MPVLSDLAIAQAMVANGRWAVQLTWDRYLEPIDVVLGVPTGTAGASAPFATALAGWQSAHQLHVDGILGPDTWTVMRRALAPPDSLTGVVPAAMPPVPHGFDEIIGTFGDPRPLLEPDGTITSTSLARWERQILAPCPVAFPLAVGGAGQTIQAFQCHRRLVGVFEAVFDELGRRGLEGAIKTWDGVFAFRAIRGDTHLSVHTFGAAIDLNAATNPLGAPGDMDPSVIAVFQHFGFLWGGAFHLRKDPMHFQYATGY
jgi:D-alanyl-D-alanine carboxypeptidase-like protein/putative peptidoglycan binding protein